MVWSWSWSTRFAATCAASSARGEQAVVKERFIRYRPGIDPKPVGKTDWARLAAMTDEEIEAAALADPDAQPLTDEELAEFVRPALLKRLRGQLSRTQSPFAKRFHINLEPLR